jgi:hypothetical protein
MHTELDLPSSAIDQKSCCTRSASTCSRDLPDVIQLLCLTIPESVRGDRRYFVSLSTNKLSYSIDLPYVYFIESA